MDVLRVVRDLDLRDWAIGAGFVRAAVWDAMTNKARPSPLADIDVIYFDARQALPVHETRAERQLLRRRPTVPWSVTNQARMHTFNGERPYRTTARAMAHWIEIPTCVGVRLAADDGLGLLAPHGCDDLLALRCRPTPSALRKMPVYRHRQMVKNWRAVWPGLAVRQT